MVFSRKRRIFFVKIPFSLVTVWFSSEDQRIRPDLFLLSCRIEYWKYGIASALNSHLIESPPVSNGYPIPDPTRNIFRIIRYFWVLGIWKSDIFCKNLQIRHFCRKNLQIRHFCRKILQMRALQRFVRFSAVPKRLPTSATLDHYDINMSTKYMFDWPY